MAVLALEPIVFGLLVLSLDVAPSPNAPFCSLDTWQHSHRRRLGCCALFLPRIESAVHEFSRCTLSSLALVSLDPHLWTRTVSLIDTLALIIIRRKGR